MERLTDFTAHTLHFDALCERWWHGYCGRDIL